MERTERTQERTKPFFPPAFQALSKYYWRELLHLSSAVVQKVQRGVSDDYRKILQRDFAAIADIGIINELQKSIKANKVISFFGGNAE